ncbi:MAG TPA: hypothetical protein VN514_03185 [Ignavibacteria bacterium]|nr:hypothetical protein [Ignavibacteria bacterium]
MKYTSLTLVLLLAMLLASCGKKDKHSYDRKSENAADSVSAIIKYELSGTGRGSITISKYRTDIRIDLEKSGDEISRESRYISGGYIYFYVFNAGQLMPVKMKIVKDHNYPKGFAAFMDAGEFIPRMNKTGSEVVAGLTCDVYADKTDGSSFSVFGGRYVLSARFSGNIITAVSAAINTPIDSNYVKVPANMEFRDISQ